MTRHVGWVGSGVLLLSLTVALVPATAASAHKRSHHSSTSVKGSNSRNAVCQDVANEQNSESAPSPQIEQAIASGNFAAAKQAMLKLYNTDLSDTQKAQAAVNSAPSGVKAAFKNLLTQVEHVKSDISNASSLQKLTTAFQSLGKNTQMDIDAQTIEDWYTSKCGSAHVTTTTVSIP